MTFKEPVRCRCLLCLVEQQKILERQKILDEPIDHLAMIEFFEKHINKLDWYQNTTIPIEFFEKHLFKLESQNTTIPIEFFEKLESPIVSDISFSRAGEWAIE